MPKHSFNKKHDENDGKGDFGAIMLLDHTKTMILVVGVTCRAGATVRFMIWDGRKDRSCA